MEFFIALAIIVAISELKEWRISIKFKKLSLEQKQLKRALDRLMDKIENQGHITDKQYTELGELKVLATKLSDDVSEAHRFIQSADTRLETIVREYELNGVPLGYQRKKRLEEEQADYVEGL